MLDLAQEGKTAARNVMAKYQRKPAVFEAEQWFPSRKDMPHVELSRRSVPIFDEFDEPWETIYELKIGPGSTTQVFPGDWIITDAQGLRGVCRDDYFRQNYEVVKDA